jgi:hypothetical protein
MPRDSSRALQHAARHAAMCEWARRSSHTGTHTALLLLASKRDELAAMLPVVREIFELHASATAQALDRWCVAAVVATSGACCSLPASPPDRHAHARRTASASHARVQAHAGRLRAANRARRDERRRMQVCAPRPCRAHPPLRGSAADRGSPLHPPASTMRQPASDLLRWGRRGGAVC